MKKVLFVIHSLGGGGAEKVLINIVNGLNPHEFDVTVMTIVDSGFHRGELPPTVQYKTLFSLPHAQGRGDAGIGGVSGSLFAGKNLIKRPLAALYMLLWKIMPSKLLYRMKIKERYDVEVSFLEGICAKFVASSSNEESRKLCWVHVDVENEPKSHKAFLSKHQERDCYDRFDTLVAVSEDVVAPFCAHVGVDCSAFEVLYNPLDLGEALSKGEEAIPSQDEPFFEGFVFCSIGRLCEQKAFDRLIDAAAILDARGCSFSVVILGEGKLEAQLRERIRERGVSQRVHLLGFKKNPFAYLARSDAYVCTSVAEGMSTTVSEAIMMGRPVITTDCSGARKLLEVGEGCIVSGRPECIAEAMRDMVESGKTGACRASEAAMAFFDHRKRMDDIVDLLSR